MLMAGVVICQCWSLLAKVDLKLSRLICCLRRCRNPSPEKLGVRIGSVKLELAKAISGYPAEIKCWPRLVFGQPKEELSSRSRLYWPHSENIKPNLDCLMWTSALFCGQGLRSTQISSDLPRMRPEWGQLWPNVARHRILSNDERLFLLKDNNSLLLSPEMVNDDWLCLQMCWWIDIVTIKCIHSSPR